MKRLIPIILAALLSVPAAAQIAPAPAASAAVAATGTSTPRTIASRAADVTNAMDNGAACDGATNDSSVITTVLATKTPVVIPAGKTCLASSIAQSSLDGVLTGPGRVTIGSSQKLAPWTSALASVPTATSTWNSINGAFSGDLRGVSSAQAHIVTGAATLGQPTTGYQQIIEASNNLVYGYNSSGYNYSTSGNGGRTGLSLDYEKVDQYGQGDFSIHFCSGFNGGSTTGYTSWLATPAIECLGGGLTAGGNGQYFEFLGDMDVTDSGYDVAAIGAVWNLNRTNATESIQQPWMGINVQSVGTKPIDAFSRFTGPAAVVADWSGASIGYYKLTSFTLTSGSGTGFAVGDTVTVSGGTSLTPTKFVVSSVSAGAVTGLTLYNAGLYTAAPVSSYTTLSWTTSGSGTGMVVSGQYVTNIAAILPATGCFLAASTVGGFPNTQASGVGSELCIGTHGSSLGGLNNINSAPITSNNVQLGDRHNALGSGTTEIGVSTYDYAQKNRIWYSSGNFAGYGDSQGSIGQVRTSATGTSTWRMVSDSPGSGVTTQNSFLIPPSSVHNLTVKCQAIDETNQDTAIWKMKQGEAYRTSAGNASYQGDLSSATTPDLSTGAGSTATMQITADTTNQNLNIAFTPPTSNTHTWHAMCKIEDEMVL